MGLYQKKAHHQQWTINKQFVLDGFIFYIVLSTEKDHISSLRFPTDISQWYIEYVVYRHLHFFGTASWTISWWKCEQLHPWDCLVFCFCFFFLWGEWGYRNQYSLKNSSMRCHIYLYCYIRILTSVSVIWT
jgi:hypothetical protein